MAFILHSLQMSKDVSMLEHAFFFRSNGWPCLLALKNNERKAK